MKIVLPSIKDFIFDTTYKAFFLKKVIKINSTSFDFGLTSMIDT